MIWTDNMLIPKGGDAHTASIYMNFVYDPKIAAQIEDYVNYICPVKGADKVLAEDRPGGRRRTRSSSRRREMLRSSTRSTPRRSSTPTTRRSGRSCWARSDPALSAWASSTATAG